MIVNLLQTVKEMVLYMNRIFVKLMECENLHIENNIYIFRMSDTVTKVTSALT